MPNSDDDSSLSSVSGGSCDYESDSFDDLCRRDDAEASAVYAAGPNEQWTHITHSNRSANMFDGLSNRVFPGNEINLEYNYADSILLPKSKAEVKHSLKSLRSKLKLPSHHKIDAVEAFAGAMPEEFLSKLFEWLKAGQAASQDKLVSFVDIIEFIRCEIILRIFGVSSSELTKLGVTEDQFKRYKRVHAAMKAADMPAAKRHAVTVANKSDNDLVTAGPAPNTFDPIMQEVLDAMNNEWAKNFFVSGESWIDVDDDKLNNSSPKFQAYGFKRTPTKDKKLKPVNHLAATIGTGNICRVTPDTLGLKLGEMLRDTIRKLCPNKALRSSMGLFLDRGYLELVKEQEVNITNLIQIICEENCKFLGTVKDSAKFPFYFVEINEDGKTVANKRLKLQMYGHRSFWTARSKNAGKTIQASVLRHGAGKKRGARIITNMPEAMTNTVVYETGASSEMRREEHETPPETPIQENANINEQISHAWKVFHSSVYIITLAQRTVEWFLGRLFRFSSTTFHAAINVAAAEYYNTRELQELHSDVLHIVKLKPTRTVTFANAADLEEEDLPSQRGALHARLASPNSMHANTTSQFWAKKSKTELKNACNNHGVAHPDFNERSTTGKVLADCLAAHFRQLAEKREREMGTRVVADDDSGNNEKATKALLCRMVPYWFTKPFQSKAGGAIDQGSANEELIITVLRPYLKDFSSGKFTSRDVKEFGLLANRGCRACASSPDGVFPLLRRHEDEEGKIHTKFVSLCGLEIKTKSAVDTTAALYEQTLRSGKWIECDSGTEEFRRAIPDNAYRSQVCQHAAALGLDYILMVYSLPGSHPKRMVLVRICAEHRAKLVKIERMLSTKYMPFAYVQNAAREICSLGEDYSNAYGYAQEHHTLELFLRIWVEYNKDLVNHGTPPSCKRIIDVATCLWNKCMGNVDTVRRVVTTTKARRGKASAPGSLYWHHLLDYILYQAFRVHQHSSIEEDIDQITTQKMFQRKRKRNRTYRAYLYQLVMGMTAQRMNRYFPGLRQRIDHMQPESITTLSSNEMNLALGAVQLQNDRAVQIQNQNDTDTRLNAPEGYNMMKLFLDPNSEFYARRLDTSLPHY